MNRYKKCRRTVYQDVRQEQETERDSVGRQEGLGSLDDCIQGYGKTEAQSTGYTKSPSLQ